MTMHTAFENRDDGQLLPRQGMEPAMTFEWRGRRCDARLAAGVLYLSAMAGRVPSTAEAGTDRPRIFAALAGLPREMPSAWTLRLTPDHRLRVEAVGPPHRSASALLGEMVGFALALDPYLDRMEAAGISAAVFRAPGG